MNHYHPIHVFLAFISYRLRKKQSLGRIIINQQTMKEELREELLVNANSTIHQEKPDEVDEEKPWQAAAMDTSSITPTLLFSTFIVVLGSFSCGFIVAYTSPVQAQIMKELDLSTADYSLFGSMFNIGGVFGAIVCGRLADYLGRKHVLRVTILLHIFGWLSIATGQGVFMLNLGRWLLGFAYIIADYAIPVYIAEFAPKNLRGGFVILHGLMIGVGASTAYLIGLVISWRTLAFIGTISSLVQIVGLFFIPESPRWLLMKSKNNEFEIVLQRLRGDSVVDEAHDLRESIEALHEMEKISFLQLFQKKYAYTLTVGIGLSALRQLVGLSGILFYASSIFESVGFSATVGTIALALIQLPSGGLSVFLMDKFGRRSLLMVSVPGLCLGCFLAGFAFVFQDHHLLEGYFSYMVLTGTMIFFVSYPVGMGGAVSVILSEIYPLNVKGLAGSMCSIVACLAGWIVSYTFNFLMEWTSSGTFFLMAGISAFTIVFVAKLVPETKGRTLEQVHASTTHVWQ